MHRQLDLYSQPRVHGVTIATLRDPRTGQMGWQAFHLPERLAIERHDTGPTATFESLDDGWFNADDTEAAPEDQVRGINADTSAFHR